MSKLSKLEKKALAELYKKMVPVWNNLQSNSDSINDVVYKQVEVKVIEDEEEQSGEQKTFNDGMKHFELLHESFEDCFDIVYMLVDHFEL